MEKEKTENSVSLNLDSDVETRKGVVAGLVMASTDGTMTRLDFINPDIPTDDGGIRAVLSARVYLTNDNLVALRDMLINHTSRWGAGSDGTASK